jgi:hypothetical protein
MKKEEATMTISSSWRTEIVADHPYGCHYVISNPPVPIVRLEDIDCIWNYCSTCCKVTFGCFDSMPSWFSFPKTMITASTLIGGFICAYVGADSKIDALHITGVSMVGISALMMVSNAFSYCYCRQESAPQSERQPLLSRGAASV